MDSTQISLNFDNRMTKDCSLDYYQLSRDASKQCLCSKCSKSNDCNCCMTRHAKLASACALPISQTVATDKHANFDADHRCSQSAIGNSIECDSFSHLESNDTVTDLIGGLPCDIETEINDVLFSNSEYYDTSELNNKINSRKLKDLFMIHMNIRSLQKNFDALHTFLSNLYKMPDIIALTETK